MTYHIRHIGPQVIGSGVKRDMYQVIDHLGAPVRTFASRADAVRDCAARNGGSTVLMVAAETAQEETK